MTMEIPIFYHSTAADLHNVALGLQGDGVFAFVLQKIQRAGHGFYQVITACWRFNRSLWEFIHSYLFMSIPIYSYLFMCIPIHSYPYIYIISMHVHAQLIQFIQLKLIRRTQIPFDTPTRWCASHRVQLYSSSSSSSLASSCACTSVTRTRPQWCRICSCWYMGISNGFHSHGGTPGKSHLNEWFGSNPRFRKPPHWYIEQVCTMSCNSHVSQHMNFAMIVTCKRVT